MISREAGLAPTSASEKLRPSDLSMLETLTSDKGLEVSFRLAYFSVSFLEAQSVFSWFLQKANLSGKHSFLAAGQGTCLFTVTSPSRPAALLASSSHTA